jgi:hypothetical protein
VAIVASYTTKRGRRVRSYVRGGESLGWLRHSSPRTHRVVNFATLGGMERKLRAEQIDDLRMALGRVRSSRRTIHPRHIHKSMGLERRIMREMAALRTGQPLRVGGKRRRR